MLPNVPRNWQKMDKSSRHTSVPVPKWGHHCSRNSCIRHSPTRQSTIRQHCWDPHKVTINSPSTRDVTHTASQSRKTNKTVVATQSFLGPWRKFSQRVEDDVRRKDKETRQWTQKKFLRPIFARPTRILETSLTIFAWLRCFVFLKKWCNRRQTSSKRTAVWEKDGPNKNDITRQRNSQQLILITHKEKIFLKHDSNVLKNIWPLCPSKCNSLTHGKNSNRYEISRLSKKLSCLFLFFPTSSVCLTFEWDKWKGSFFAPNALGSWLKLYEFPPEHCPCASQWKNPIFLLNIGWLSCLILGDWVPFNYVALGSEIWNSHHLINSNWICLLIVLLFSLRRFLNILWRS